MQSLVLSTLRKDNSNYADRAKSAISPNVSVPTDFTIYDYMNASIEKHIDPKGNVTHYLDSGMITGIHSSIGKTQSGKTTLAVKSGASIVSKFENSVFYVRDAEKTMTIPRISELTGWTPEQFQGKFDYTKLGIDHDFIYNDIRTICQGKENLKKEIMIDTGRVDINGNPIKMYPPDVYLIDSLPALNCIDDDENIKDKSKSFDVKEEKVNQRIEGLFHAGSTKLLLVKLQDMIFKYNIRLILINHIAPNTQIGGNPNMVQKQMMFLKQNEKLPGGIAYLHYCTNITRSDAVSVIRDDEFGPLIVGMRNRITMVKNKSNISGVPVEVIADQRTGINSVLSTFNYLLNRGYGLTGNPRSYSLLNCPSYSFTKRTFWEKCLKDFKEYGLKSPLINSVIVTGRRCLYYDFVLGRPDPNPNNWMSGSVANRVDPIRGVQS